MNIQLQTKSKIFKGDFEIYQNNDLIGAIHFKTFAKNELASLNSKKLCFSSYGFLKFETWVNDFHTNERIGIIKYNSWKNEAYIEINSITYAIKSDSFMSDKWKLTLNDKELMLFDLKTTHGIIEFDEWDEVLILSAIKAINYMNEMNTVAVSSLVSVIAVIITGIR